MLRNNHIKKFIAGFILVIFAFSIAPRIAPHFWCTNHDTKEQQTNQLFIAKAQFACNCGNIDLATLFTPADAPFVFTPLQSFLLHQQTSVEDTYAITHSFFSLRAPPAVS